MRSSSAVVARTIVWTLLWCPLHFSGCPDSDPVPSSPSKPDHELQERGPGIDLEPGIVTFCGACHAFPKPESFPQDAWYGEVRRGYNFYYESGRSDLDPPPLADVVSYFRARAAERLVLPEPAEAAVGDPLRFRRSEIAPVRGSTAEPGAPAVSFIARLASTDALAAPLLVSEMRHSLVLLGAVDGNETFQGLNAAANPAAVRSCDLDGDGRAELLVADLGSFLPEDHDRGGVLWLPDGPVLNGRPPVALLSGVGRVADVSVGDFNGDGREDILVAEFGWHKTGSIRLMQNRGSGPDGTPAFETTIIDERSGTIHVPTCDLNGDGRLDFIALISQEHEVIEAFLGNGDGTFDVRRIDDAGDPAFGSSGIQLVDLDQDGDLDVLSTNGDTFDSQYIKPFHGIRWLENKGDYPFRVHALTRMPGVYRALAADLDGDGDLDIAACALLPRGLLGDLPDRGLDSVIWLEQVSPRHFERRPIEQQDLTRAAMLVEDLNGDGRKDIMVGRFSERRDDASPMLTVYWNDGSAQATKSPAE